ncbi:hypothetical protein EDD11_006987 [Mortierella claussenii]|nr:hypothetical protein EDD11_006987 [Mortierella claussenii]
MVLTRSKSNNQGTTPAPAPAKPAAPVKRKSTTSATAAAKVSKTEDAKDVTEAKELTAADPVVIPAAGNVADAPLVPAQNIDTSASITIEALPATTAQSAPMEVPAAPPAPAAPAAATIPAPVDVTVVAPVAAPIVASIEEPSVHNGASASVHALHPYDVIVSDIEGTTTPIVFVKENLFPYVASKLPEFLVKNWSSNEMKEAVEALRVQANKDIADGLSAATPIATESADVPSEKVQQDVIASIAWQMQADRKIGALKAFQGYMWKEGYGNGDLKGALYEDVISAFDAWKAEGKKLYIYSSGSIAAQKLLFGFSEKGDVLHYFSGHFDTTTGPKVEAGSYTKIAADIGVEPARILFLSDNIHEIVAAKKAGLQTVLTDRPGNAPLTTEDRASNFIVKSFLEIPKPQ